MRTFTKELQDQITPQKAITILKEGNHRFINNLKVNRNLLQQVNETRNGQHPFAVIISCMDSRAPAEIIFDQGLGDIFSIRVAGNVINEDILGSAEYGCKVAGAKVVVVLGHTHCGAIKGAINGFQMGNLNSLLNKIQFSIPHHDSKYNLLSSDEKIHWMTDKNVNHSLNEIRNRSAILRDMEENGEIALIGGIYDINTGAVTILEK